MLITLKAETRIAGSRQQTEKPQVNGAVERTEMTCAGRGVQQCAVCGQRIFTHHSGDHLWRLARDTLKIWLKAVTGYFSVHFHDVLFHHGLDHQPSHCKDEEAGSGACFIL